jgi:chromosome segregation ATPase
MVMRPDPRVGALTRVKRRDFGPWWLWVVVVVLAGSAAYYGYKARFLEQRLSETDVVTSALTTDNTGLRTSVADLERDVTAANARAAKEHSDAEAVSGLLAKLQKRMSDLVTELATAQQSLTASRQESERLRVKAEGADTATAQLQKLQESITALKGDLEKAKSDLGTARGETDASRKAIERLTAEAAAAATAKSLLEREIADLQKSLAETRQKLEAATASSSTTPAQSPH